MVPWSHTSQATKRHLDRFCVFAQYISVTNRHSSSMQHLIHCVHASGIKRKSVFFISIDGPSLFTSKYANAVKSKSTPCALCKNRCS